MTYSLTRQEVTEDHFHWEAEDGSALTFTKATIADLIAEFGMEGAVSNMFSALNTTFANYLAEGTTTIEIAPDGTPITCTMES